MTELLLYPILASVLVAIVCGVMGPLTLLRHNTYAAGAISHACFAGLGAARYCTVVFGLGWLSPMAGALLVAIGTALFLASRRNAAVGKTAVAGSSDSALSAVWAVGMAIGLLFLSATPGYQSDLINYLFGSILLVTPDILVAMAILALLIPLAVFLFRRGILSVSFNAEAATLRGEATAFYERVISILTACTVVLLVRTVGIILVIALLTLPPLAARRIAKRLPAILCLSFGFTLLSLFAGLALSWYFDIQPSAPTVLIAGCIALLARAYSACRRKYAYPCRHAHHLEPTRK